MVTIMRLKQAIHWLNLMTTKWIVSSCTQYIQKRSCCKNFTNFGRVLNWWGQTVVQNTGIQVDKILGDKCSHSSSNSDNSEEVRNISHYIVTAIW